jgi:hypothetical protein
MDLDLGVLIASAERLETALSHVVHPERTLIFLMDDGVCAQEAPRLRALIDAGADVTLCAQDAEARGLHPYDGGPRFGSQYDHARMMRDVGCVVAATHAGTTKSRPQGPRRRIGVTLTGDPKEDPRATVQALRSAVGYLGCELDVRIKLGSRALGLLGDDPPREVLRHLATLRGLGTKIEPLPGAPIDVEVIW